MVLAGHYLEGGVGTGTNRGGGGGGGGGGWGGGGGGGSGMFLRKKLGGDKKLCTFIVIEV